MTKHLFTVFLFILLSFSLAKAQKNYCSTEMSKEQLKELRNFQQLLASGSFKKKAGLSYVPIQFHILGNNNGVGYYKLETLLYTICELNKDFAPSGFYFYMADLPNYINDNDLYRGDMDAIYLKAEDYKLNGAVNVFFQGTGNQWCGVYFGDVDVVFVLNRCQLTGATTLTHELGHFFGLPHTFFGWEGGNNPGNSFTERLDGSNCRDAGDGFCDTKADYVSSRWDCPLAYQLQDPTGAYFKPDSSIYMSYSSDRCQSRFSDEQMAAMNNNLNSRNIATPPVNKDTLNPARPLFPLAVDSNLNPNSIRFVWNSVEGAFAYYIQVARFGDWEFTNFEALVSDTFVDCKTLYGDWSYSYRIKAISQGNTCGDFSETKTFTTKVLPTGNSEIRIKTGLGIFPNPVQEGSKLQIVSDVSGKVILWDAQGKQIEEHFIEAGIPLILTPNSNGLFMGRFENELMKQSFKVLVNPTP